MSLGFQRAGYQMVAAFDAWEDAVRCYSNNFDHPAIQLDLSNVAIAVKEISGCHPDIIIGGPPCQDFSSAGKRIEERRADLTMAFSKIVTSIQPRAFVMENVERARLSKAYEKSRKVFVKAGYCLTEVVLDASYYGVPQARKRFFCIGTVRDHSDTLFGELQGLSSESRMSVREYLGNEFGVERYYRHPRNYSRRAIYSIDEPSPTVRGVNRPVPPGYPGHPLDAGKVTKDLRPLTTLERARIQTFPPDFRFEGSKSSMELLIGNAVPVELARSVAEALSRTLSTL